MVDHDKTAHNRANPVEPEKETEDDSPWPEDRETVCAEAVRGTYAD